MAVPAPTVNVSVELPAPGAAIGFTLKPAVVPDGTPVAESVTALLNPPLTVVLISEVPDDAWATVSEAGDAESVKSGGAVVMVRFTLVVLVLTPPTPVRVIG